MQGEFNRNDDELLRSLIKRIPMSRVPDGFTGSVMERIKKEAVIYTDRSIFLEWWWIAVMIISPLSVYFSGLHSYAGRVVLPYLYDVITLFSSWFIHLYELLPSGVVFLPETVVIPAVISVFIIFLMTDIILRENLHRSGER